MVLYCSYTNTYDYNINSNIIHTNDRVIQSMYISTWIMHMYYNIFVIDVNGKVYYYSQLLTFQLFPYELL